VPLAAGVGYLVTHRRGEPGGHRRERLPEGPAAGRHRDVGRMTPQFEAHGPAAPPVPVGDRGSSRGSPGSVVGPMNGYSLDAGENLLDGRGPPDERPYRGRSDHEGAATARWNYTRPTATAGW